MDERRASASDAPGGPGPPSLGGLLRARRLALGLSLQRLADRVGCAKSYLSQIETGRAKAPADHLLQALETALELDAGELAGAARWERTPEPVRGAFAELEKANRAGKRLAELIAGGVDETGKPVGRLDRAYRSGELKRLVDSLVGPSEPEQAAAGSRVESGEVHDDPLGEAAGGGAVRVELPMEVPLINRVQAGYPTEFTDLGYPARVADEYVRCPDLRDPDAFAARVVGDSMAPEYKEGDIVVFSPQQTIENGMDCFARLEPDHTSTFKRVYFERGEGDQQRIRLQPINNSYPPQVLDREQVAGLYAAVTVMRSLV